MMNSYWLFLGFLLVPILIHLFNFKRAKKQLFSNVAFIAKALLKSKVQSRLKHYLILFSRLGLFCTLLALLFPFTDLKTSEQSENFVVYLDNSINASHTTDGISYLASNKNSILDLLKNETLQVGLITNEFASYTTHLKTMDEIENELQNIGYAYMTRSLDAVLQRIDEFEVKKILMFSDFQHVDHAALDRILKDTTKNYTLIYNTLENKRNAYIDTLYILDHSNDMKRFKLAIRLGFSSNYEKGNLVVKVFENERQLASVVHPAQNQSSIVFDIPVLKQGHFIVELSGDDLDYDNRFYFWYERHKKPKIILHSKNPDTYLSAVYNNVDLFDVVVTDETDFADELLKNPNLVIFNQLETIPQGTESLTSTSFVLIPSDTIDIKSYRSFLDIQLEKNVNPKKYELKVDTKNPLFQGVFEKSNPAQDLPVATALYLPIGKYESMINLRSGHPFLVKQAQNKYFFTSSFQEQFTDILSHALFLPVMYRLAYRSILKEDIPYHYPNEIVEVATEAKEQPLKLSGKGFERVPDFFLSDRGVSVRLPVNIPPGHYDFVQANDTVAHAAINLSKSESIPTGIKKETLIDYLSGYEHIQIYDQEDIKNQYLSDITENLSNWKYLLFLALFFILIETLLHRYTI